MEIVILILRVININKELFSDEYVNKGLQNELNWGKAIAILFMVMIHIVQNFENQLPMDNIYGVIYRILMGQGAGIFIGILGVLIFYSSRNTPKKLFIRGGYFLIFGYVFNLVVRTIPYLILYLKTHDAFILDKAIAYLFTTDIFQFVALAFIFFAVVKKLKLNNYILLLIGLISLLFYNLASNFYFGNVLLDGTLGLFIQTNGESFFPFFGWIIFGIAGYIFGSFLIRCKNKDKFYKQLFFFSSLFFIIMIMVLNYGFYANYLIIDNDYIFFIENLLENIFFIAFMLTILSILYFLQKYNKSKLLDKTLNRWSKNITSIYIISLAIITYLGVTEFLVLPANVLYYFLLFLAIFIASDILAILYSKYLKPKISNYKLFTP